MGATRNHEPPPPPPPVAGKPSIAGKILKFIAIAAAGGIITEIALSKWRSFTKKEEIEEEQPMLNPMGGGTGGQFQLFQMMPSSPYPPPPYPYPAPQFHRNYPPPPPTPEPEEKPVYELTPEEVYERTLTDLERKSAARAAKKAWERREKDEAVEELEEAFEEDMA